MQPDVNRADLVARTENYLRTRPSAEAEMVVSDLEQKHTWRQIAHTLDRLDAVGWGRPHGKTARYSKQLITVMLNELPKHTDHDGDWEPEPINLRLPPDQMPNRESRRYPKCGTCFDSGKVWEDPSARADDPLGYEFVSAKVPCPHCRPDPNRSPDVSNERGAELARQVRAQMAEAAAAKGNTNGSILNDASKL